MSVINSYSEGVDESDPVRSIESCSSYVTQLEIRLTTEEAEYAVPDCPLIVPSNVDCVALNNLVISMLSPAVTDSLRALPHKTDVLNNDSNSADYHFDFFVDDQLLCSSLTIRDLIAESTCEHTIHVQYSRCQQTYVPTPRPHANQPHDDWVSCVRTMRLQRHLLCVYATYNGSLCVRDLQTINTDGASGDECGWSADHLHAHKQPIKCVDCTVSVGCHDNMYVATGSIDQTIVVWRVAPSTLSSSNIDNQACNTRKSRNKTGEQAGKRKRRQRPDSGKDEESGSAHVSAHCGLQFTAVARATKHSKSVDTLRYNPSTHVLASGSWDSHIYVHGPHEGAPGGDTELNTLLCVTGHQEAVSCVDWAAPQRLVSASWDHTVRVWDVETTDGATCVQQISTEKAVFCVRAQAGTHDAASLLLTSSADRCVRLYDTRAGGAAVSVVSGHSARVYVTPARGCVWCRCVAWRAGGSVGGGSTQFVSAGEDGLMRLWDTRCSRAPLYELIGHRDRVLCCDWLDGGQSGDGVSYIVSGSTDNTLKVFSV